MKVAKLIVFAGLLAMSVVLIYAFATGSFTTEGRQLLSMPWGVVSLVDLYVGFTLFSCWIVYRERSWKAAAWVILMMVLGFWTGCLYTLLALQNSKGDWQRFWMGRRAPAAQAPRASEP
jgi:cytochrome bd-type quinol oxidase subunit 2